MPETASLVTSDFLTSLFRGLDGCIEFRLIGPDRVTQSFLELNNLSNEWEDVERSLQEANSKGAGIYFSVNPREKLWTAYWTDKENKKHFRGFDRKEAADIYLGNKTEASEKRVSEKPESRSNSEYVKRCAAIWLNLEYRGELLKQNVVRLETLQIEPSIIVDSGTSYSYYWLLQDPCTPAQACDVVRELIRVVGGTESALDRTVVLPLPNTNDTKDPQNPVPCKLLRLDRNRKYNLSDFDSLRDAPSAERPEIPLLKDASRKSALEKPTGSNGNSWVHQMARNLSPFWIKSYQHNLASALAQLLKKSEVPKSKAIDVVVAIANLAKDEELEERRQAVESAYAAPESRTTGSTLVQQVLGREQGKEFFKQFNQIMSTVPPPPIIRATFPTFSIYDCIPTSSLFDAYLNYATKYTDSPAQFHIASLLTLAAAALGNHVWVPYYGKQKLYANLYSLMIGPPGRVRKSTAVRLARDLGKKSDVAEYPADATVEQLYARLAPDAIETENIEIGNGKTKDIPVAWEGNPHGIIYHSEFSRYLNSTNKGYMQDSRSFFTDLYDGGKLVRETKSRGKYYIEDPAISMLCGITPAALKRTLTQGDIGDGFLSRFLIVVRPPKHEANYDLIVDESVSDVDLYSDILDRLQRMMRQGGPIPIPRKGEADKIRMEFEHWVDTKGDKYEEDGLFLLDSLICRLKSMATKIALIYTCDAPVGPLEITPEAMTLATNLCRYIAGTMEPFFEMVQPDDGNRERRFRNQVLETIRRWYEATPNKPMPHRQLIWRSSLDAEQVRRAADSLYQEGRIQIQTVYNGRGKLYFLNEKTAE